MFSKVGRWIALILVAGLAVGCVSVLVRIGVLAWPQKPNTPYEVNGIIVISKAHRVASEYVVEGPEVFGLTEEAGAAYRKMVKAAKKAGFAVKATTGFRDWEKQTEIWNRNVETLGPDQGEAAPPGASEHNLGIAVDLSTDELVGHSFGNSNAGKWIAKNAHKFGFIMRYPKGKTDITGYNFEPWHFRYIGVKDAKAFAKNKSLTLEEYLDIA